MMLVPESIKIRVYTTLTRCVDSSDNIGQIKREVEYVYMYIHLTLLKTSIT